jgi:hypothetical protein
MPPTASGNWLCRPVAPAKECFDLADRHIRLAVEAELAE